MCLFVLTHSHSSQSMMFVVPKPIESVRKVSYTDVIIIYVPCSSLWTVPECG